PAGRGGRRARSARLRGRGGRRRGRTGGQAYGETLLTAAPENLAATAPAFTARGDTGGDLVSTLDPALTPERFRVAVRGEDHHDRDRQKDTHAAILDGSAAGRQRHSANGTTPLDSRPDFALSS